mmetsp:Transcript_21157/g.63146  ORF Transcript_21157/g.63146 Transcript_21157/m.63146 type:complete len:290 (+) Transcript_21157:71-940(+)
MSKLLFSCALVAGVLLMLQPPPPRPFPQDAAYLRAVADVHEFCAADFDRFCGAQIAPEPSPARRLATVFMDMEVVEEADMAADHGPKGRRAPLKIGRPQDDRCLRASYASLSEECAAAIALVDETAPEHKRHGVCPAMLGLWIAALAGLSVLGAKLRHKKRITKKLLDVLRGDLQLKALVEAKAGVEVPEPCQCCGMRAFLAGALLALGLSALTGPGSVFAASLLAAAFRVMARACLACCKKTEAAAVEPDAEAPPAYDECCAEKETAKAAEAALKEVTVSQELEKPLL